MFRLAALRSARIDGEPLSREVRSASPRPSAKRPSSASDEREEVARALARSGGNISHAAVFLGLTRHGLKKRMLRLGMSASALGQTGQGAAHAGQTKSQGKKRAP